MKRKPPLRIETLPWGADLQSGTYSLQYYWRTQRMSDLVKRLRPDPQYKTALEIALEDAIEAIPSLATLQLMLGQGDYPAFPDVVRSALRDMASAADRIEALEAALAEKEAEVARLRDAYDQGWDFAFRQWQRTGSVPDPSYKKAPAD